MYILTIVIILSIHHIHCWNSYDLDTNDYNIIYFLVSFYWSDIPFELFTFEIGDVNAITR